MCTDQDMKIKVKIKPLSPTGTAPTLGNVDDIRTSMGMLRLSPTLAVRPHVEKLILLLHPTLKYRPYKTLPNIVYAVPVIIFY